MLPGPVSTALFTTKSMPPHSSAAVAAAAPTDSRSRRSATSGSARLPSSRIDAAVVSRLPGSARPPPVSEVSRPSPSRTVRPLIATSHPERAERQRGRLADAAGRAGDHRPPPVVVTHRRRSTRARS